MRFDDNGSGRQGQARRTERPRGGIKAQLDARRRRGVPAGLAAVVWTRADGYGLPGELTPLADMRCLVLRVFRRGFEAVHGLATYAPRFRAADGAVVLGPAECRSLHDVQARFRDRGELDPARSKIQACGALAGFEAVDDLRADRGRDAGMRPPLPEAFFGFADVPAFEASPYLREKARAEHGLPRAAEPSADQLASTFDNLWARVDGLVWMPAGLFVRGRAATHDVHPLDGSPPPAAEPGDEGAIAGGWVVRDGRWIPTAQRPERVAVANELLAGHAHHRENPARLYLERAGLLAPGEDVAGWDAARDRAFREALCAPERADWLARMTRTLADAGGEPRVASPLLNHLPSPGHFAAEDLARMLMEPLRRPFASGAPRAFVVRNDPAALAYAGGDWEVDLGSVPAAHFDRIRIPAPPAAVAATA